MFSYVFLSLISLNLWIEIIIVFQKFGVGACVLIVLNVMCFLLDRKYENSNYKCKITINVVILLQEWKNVIISAFVIKKVACMFFFILTSTARVISKHHLMNAVCLPRIEPLNSILESSRVSDAIATKGHIYDGHISSWLLNIINGYIVKIFFFIMHSETSRL